MAVTLSTSTHTAGASPEEMRFQLICIIHFFLANSAKLIFSLTMRVRFSAGFVNAKDGFASADGFVVAAFVGAF